MIPLPEVASAVMGLLDAKSIMIGFCTGVATSNILWLVLMKERL